MRLEEVSTRSKIAWEVHGDGSKNVSENSLSMRQALRCFEC